VTCELLGEREAGGRVMLRGVLVNFPGPIFVVANLPVLDVEWGGMIQPQEVEAVVLRQWGRGAQAGPVAGGLPLDGLPLAARSGMC